MDMKIRKLYDLKKVERYAHVGDRKENSAEHTWSALMVADYFLSTMENNLDRLKVYELLMYHDVVEIEAGDVPMHHNQEGKHEREMEAMPKLKRELPDALGLKFVELFTEFEECKTPEAKFAKAMDKFDSTLHELDYKDDWKGWTEEMVRELKDPPFKDFPEIKKAHDELIEFVKKEGYLDQ